MKRNLFWGTLAIAIAAIAATFVPVTQANSDKVESPSGSNLSTTITISQAYGGGGGATGTYTVDYVELKNISASPQSLSGLSLMYGSATGQFGSSATNTFALPAVSLNPGQYYLVQLSTAGMGGVPLPVPADAVTTNLAMSGTNGKVALVTSAFTSNTCGATATPCTLPNANIIDLVSWGTANNAEGGASTNGGASLTATQGNVRKNGGCTETDNNNADFDIITAPVPRNTSTTTACGAVAVTQNHVDFDGNGRTDFTVVRNTGGGPSGQITWFINANGPGTTSAFAWGLAPDYFVPADYDGDNKTDIAIWREAPATVAAFYILESATNTARVETFGQLGDNPKVVADYSGDGKADLAVYREGTSSGLQSTWFFRSTPGGPTTYMPWGINGDFPAPGDYDGDGKSDFAVQRNDAGNGRFWRMQTTAGFDTVLFGNASDVIVPGDYDGDGKTDIATVRGSGGQIVWFVRPSTTGVNTGAPTATFGASATDFPTVGDYDGDGKTDFAIWRPSATPGASAFWYLGSGGGTVAVPFGANGDYPVANYNTF